MPYRARWRGPADPPAALLTLTACRYQGDLEEALTEALAVLGVELVECCHPAGEPCHDCRAELDADRDDRAYDAERDRRLLAGMDT
jgi:hypothetical protein